MLAEARRRLPSGTFLLGTAERLPVAAASVDLVTAAGSINYADPGTALGEISRVLVPGGYVVIYDFSTGRVLPLHEPGESAFPAFVQTFPWPQGYELSLGERAYALCGLSLSCHEAFDVDLKMTEDEYLEYLLGETNIEAAISGGMSEHVEDHLEEINTLTSCWSNTMSTILQETEAVATGAWTEGRIVYLELTDQRIIGFPATRFRRPKEASEAELADVRLEVGGTALRWESLDEDISVEGVVAGRFQLPPTP